jgi:AcrR family transcriptional regulator
MGIAERRAREREQRRAEILGAAWEVAEQTGWAGFSLERVAVHAELGRATVYGYFESFDALVLELARDALGELTKRVATTEGLAEALDVPVRFAQKRPAAFALLFPPANDPRLAFSNERLEEFRAEARQLVGRLQRLAARSKKSLPEDARSAAAFLAAISIGAAVVPELRASTTLRRKFQEFCLRDEESKQPATSPADTPVGKRR